MPFLRLSDDYADGPKFDNLSDGAFRLWHQGMCFCRKYQTDGLIPIATLRKFKSYSQKRARELETPWRDGANPLWQRVEGFGVRVHDYLDWNLSREEEESDRDAAAARMRRLRAGKKTGPFVSGSPVRSREQVGERSPIVPERVGKDLLQEEEKKIGERAGRLIERYRDEWYPQYRHGARLRLIASNLEFQEALSLVNTWDDARLEKLARIVLTTDDSFIAGTDRSFRIFALKASWADDRLKQAETRAS